MMKIFGTCLNTGLHFLVFNPRMAVLLISAAADSRLFQGNQDGHTGRRHAAQNRVLCQQWGTEADGC